MSIHSTDQVEVRRDGEAAVLDEKVWQAWVHKGALRERRSADRRMTLVKCAGLAILAATAVLWRSLSEFDFFIRLGVSLSGLAILFQALRLRRYAFVAIFAAVIVAYNPIVPTFGLSGTEAHAFVVSTMLPFAASLIWLRPVKPADQEARPSSDAERAFFSGAKGTA
jgi:hypothetical protein